MPESAVGDLNDECFSLATELVAQLCEAFEDEIERKPTISELCEILTEGIRGCATDILHDVNVESLIELKPKLAKRGKITLTPGDVIAIPAEDGTCYLSVYLGLFRISGEVMGILAGKHPCHRVAASTEFIAIARPIFFHKLGVTSGRWRIVGHRPDLLSLFPHPPEYYYAKQDHQDDEGVGPFGSAETAQDFTTPVGQDAPLRHLSEQEAREIGLLEADFFQSGLVQEVEAYLNRLIGARHDVSGRTQ